MTHVVLFFYFGIRPMAKNFLSSAVIGKKNWISIVNIFYGQLFSV